MPCSSLWWHQGELLLRTLRVAASLVGSPVTLQAACDVLRVKALLWLESMTWDLVVTWPSRPAGRCSCQIGQDRRLLRFQNGSGDLVVGNADATALFCSPNGVLYVLSQFGRTVQKLVGSTLQTVIASESLPADMQFKRHGVCNEGRGDLSFG